MAQANAAVVSVIISKDLPVIERYYQTIDMGNGIRVRVPRTRQQGSQEQVVGGGTAFFVSNDGLLMTNKHVVSDPGASYTVLLNDGQKVKATVLQVDNQNDIALLKIDRTNTPPLTLAGDNDIHLGQTAIAIGNSLGEYRNTVSVGVVSGLGRSITAETGLGNGTETLSEIIQTDAAINQGNSGGPLLDILGNVIGMNTAVAASGQNIGFAIPASELRRVLTAYGR